MQPTEKSPWPYHPFKQAVQGKRHCSACNLSAGDQQILKKVVVLFLDIKDSSEMYGVNLLSLIKYLELTGRRVGIVLPENIEVEKASMLGAFVIGRTSPESLLKEHQVYRSVVLDKQWMDEGMEAVLKKIGFNQGDLDIAEDVIKELALEAVEKYRGWVSENDIYSKSIRQSLRSKQYQRVWKNQFPLNLLDISCGKQALKKACEEESDILTSYLKGVDWLDENSLNALFKEYVQRVATIECHDICHRLHMAYEKGNLKAGYYLLWLIKTAAGCAYTLPSKDEFSGSDLFEILNVDALNGKMSRPTLFVELLLVRQIYLNLAFFPPFASRVMMEYSKQVWPEKNACLLKMLSAPHPTKMIVVKGLAHSEDPETKEIGTHLLNVFKAENYTSALPSLYALKSLIPEMKNGINAISGFPLPSFRYRRERGLPQFVTAIDFHDTEMFFEEDEHFVVVEKHTQPHYLLTFDCMSEKIIWGLPLEDQYSLRRVGNQIAYLIEDERTVRFFSLKTGELINRLELPVEHHALRNQIYKSADDVVYYKSDKLACLFSKSLQEECWKAFLLDDHYHQLIPLSTHCGLLNHVTSELSLFGPTDVPLQFNECSDVYANEDQLFIIQKVPEQGKSLLSIRKLSKGNDPVSEVHTEIFIPALDLKFGTLCKNGELVLVSGYYEKKILFVNPLTKEVRFGERDIPEKTSYLIDRWTGAVWVNDYSTGRLWRISSKGTQDLSKSICSGKLFHINKVGQLYLFY